MTTILDWARPMLMGFFIFMAYAETGPWTAISLAFIALTIEVMIESSRATARIQQKQRIIDRLCK